MNTLPTDHAYPTATTNVKVIDKDTGEILVDDSNAIHFGNLSVAIVRALSTDDAGHLRYMGFGNGGVSLTAQGQLFYKTPNVSTLSDPNADLYNPTYEKDLSVDTPENNISIQLYNANFHDIICTCTLEKAEPVGQDVSDDADNLDGDFVFDEICIRDNSGEGPGGVGRMVGHILFHPIQKSANRRLEIIYTIRIIMSQ